jgi:hypothetical protein
MGQQRKGCIPSPSGRRQRCQTRPAHPRRCCPPPRCARARHGGVSEARRFAGCRARQTARAASRGRVAAAHDTRRQLPRLRAQRASKPPCCAPRRGAGRPSPPTCACLACRRGDAAGAAGSHRRASLRNTPRSCDPRPHARRGGGAQKKADAEQLSQQDDAELNPASGSALHGCLSARRAGGKPRGRMASAWAAGPPKAPAAAAAAAGSAADWQLGSAVKLTTVDGEAVSGEARATRPARLRRCFSLALASVLPPRPTRAAALAAPRPPARAAGATAGPHHRIMPPLTRFVAAWRTRAPALRCAGVCVRCCHGAAGAQGARRHRGRERAAHHKPGRYQGTRRGCAVSGGAALAAPCVAP